MGRRAKPTARARQAAPVARPAGLRRWWPVAVLVIVGGLAYANTLRNPFIFDDLVTVTDNPSLRHLTDLRAVFAPPPESPVAGRPVVELAFALNYALGGLNVWGYHAWNIATHLVCALLFFAIVRWTLRRESGWLATEATPLAVAAAVLWLVHPLNTDAVDYVTQRTELTMGACLLLTLYASLRAFDGPSRTAWTVGAILACAAGMASKESMVTAPILVVLYDRIFLFASWQKAWAARKSLYLGLAATWIVLLGLLMTTERRNDLLQWVSPYPVTAAYGSGVSPGVYLLNQFPIVLRYLSLAFWPHGLVQNYGWPEPVRLVSVLPSLVVVSGLVAATIALFWVRPKLAFLAAWVWITLAPTSSLLPIAKEVGAERRMYVPLLALVVLVVVGAAALVRRVDWRAQLAVVTAVAVSLFAVTVLRNVDYASPLTLAEETVARRPTPVARHVLGTELLAAGQHEAALAELRLAVTGAPRARYTLGVELLQAGQTDEGIAELQAFVKAEPHLEVTAEALDYLGKAYAQRQEWAQASAEFQALLALNPGNLAAERLLADADLNGKDLTDAIAHYQHYVAAAPTDFDAFNELGAALGATGDLKGALAAFSQAESLNATNGPVERNLAYIYFQQHDLAQARLHAERAVALEPDDAESAAFLRMLQHQR